MIFTKTNFGYIYIYYIYTYIYIYDLYVIITEASRDQNIRSIHVFFKFDFVVWLFVSMVFLIYECYVYINPLEILNFQNIIIFFLYKTTRGFTSITTFNTN